MTSNQSHPDLPRQFRARRLVLHGDDPRRRNAQEQIDRTVAAIPVRFANALETVEKIEAMVANNDSADLGLAQQFGKDLCDAYCLSSGYLTNVLGPDLLLRTFRALKPIWWAIASHDEYEAYLNLDEKLVLYRGGIGPVGELAKGFSWTLNQYVAHGFMDAPDSLMIRAEIRKTDLLLYFPDDDECIVDPATPASISLVDEFDQ
jgi:hypothetical protein